MTHLRGPHLALLLLLAMPACAGNQQSGTMTRNQDLITRDEVLAVSRGTAWEVVEYLRPQWFRGRSEQTPRRAGGILVYVDDVRFGGLESLRLLAASDVHEMRRYNATAASQRWGPGHSEGVIAVRTRATGG